MRLGLLLPAIFWLTTGLMAATSDPAHSAETGISSSQTIFITEYQIVGTRGLPRLNLSAVVSPYLGPDQNRKKVALARAALLQAYHDAGIFGITVQAPTTQSKPGIVRLQVVADSANRSSVRTAPASSPVDSQPDPSNRTLIQREEDAAVGGSPVGGSLLATQRVQSREQARSHKFNGILPASPDALPATVGAALRRDMLGEGQDQHPPGSSEQLRSPSEPLSGREAAPTANQAEAGEAPTTEILAKANPAARATTTAEVLPTTNATVVPAAKNSATTGPREPLQPLELAKTEVASAVLPIEIAVAASVTSTNLNVAEIPSSSGGTPPPDKLVRSPETAAQPEVVIQPEQPRPVDPEVQPANLRAARELVQTKEEAAPQRSASAAQKLADNLALKAAVRKRSVDSNRTLTRPTTNLPPTKLPASDTTGGAAPMNQSKVSPTITAQKTGGNVTTPLASRPIVAGKKTPLAPISGAASPSDKITQLLNHSPFGQMSANGATRKATAEPLEFRAVLEEDKRRFFSLFETSTQRSVWVGMNQSTQNMLVTKYDSEAASIVVEYNGRSLTLPLKGGVPQPRQIGAAPPSAKPVASASEYHDRPFRLGHVAEEMQIRRAVRQSDALPKN